MWTPLVVTPRAPRGEQKAPGRTVPTLLAPVEEPAVEEPPCVEPPLEEPPCVEPPLEELLLLPEEDVEPPPETLWPLSWSGSAVGIL